MIEERKDRFSPVLMFNRHRWAVASLVLILAAGAACTWWEARSEDREMRQGLLADARLVAHAIDLHHLQSLSGSDADVNSPEYQRLKEQLILVRSAKAQCRFLYLMGQRRDGVVFFFVDSEPLDSNDYSPPGQVYEEASDDLRRAFATSRQFVEGPVSDHWGTWVSALVPITDPGTGKLLAIFGADVDASDWGKQIAIRCAAPILIALLFAALLASVFMIQRLTERKKTEKLIAEGNARLSESNRQLQEFAYIVSHDLREPTRKITAFGQLLGESLYDKLNEDEEENLRYMIDGADRMQKMVEAVLEYSRVTTRGAAFEVVDLNEIVEQLKGFELAVSIKEAGALILVPAPLPPVKADSAQVRQLLQNLIANAVKYRKKDVAPEVIIHGKNGEHAMVRIEVQDNGIGIKAEQLENLFVMFRQLHKRGEYEGMGIGLAVCKKIVERNGGRIGVESVYGEGSTFWFTLPAASTAKDQPEPALSSYGLAEHS